MTVAAIRARARDYELRARAAEDAGQVSEEQAKAAPWLATVAIVLYEMAEALEQNGDDRCG